MSTKITLAHGANFHFYSEGFDDDFVYLELADVDFEATSRRITVPIPIAVWETVRQKGGTSFDLAEASDEEITGRVEKEVGERIASLLEARKKGGSNRFIRPSEWLVYGKANETREVQIAEGIEFYRRERKRQRAIKLKMQEYKTSERK